jgi:bacterioferritin
MRKNNSMTKSIENLQAALSKELTSIQQYLLHTHVLVVPGLDHKLVFQGRVWSER